MRWVATDVETGGFSPVEHGVCEVAWLEVDDDFNEVDRFHSLVDPQKPISAGASGTHGILDADVVDAPTLAEVMTVVRSLPFSIGPIAFIAHNAKFDWQFLGEWFPKNTQLLCTLRLTKQIFPDLENYKLQTLRVIFGLGVNKGDAHSALADTEVLLKLLKHMADHTGYSLPDMLELSQRAIPISKIGFGKHKGSKLADLPSDYVTWMLGPKGPANLDPDLRVALEAL